MVRYVRVRFHGKYERGDHERVNRQEAELLVEQLRSYIQKISKERVLEENIDFGLISPYKAQVQYIRKLIKQDAFFNLYAD